MLLDGFYEAAKLNELNDISILFRLILSMLLGGIIGFERGRSGRPAGLRTHMLVCLGSTMAIMTNEYIHINYGTSDPTRMAAQVISGIGFLGAGTIIVTGRHQVKGLTTAAGLWATACLGLAIGIGFYNVAIIGTILISFVTVVLHRLDSTLLAKSRVLDIYLEFTESGSIVYVLEHLKQMEIIIDSIEMVKPSYGTNSSMAAILNLHLKKKGNRMDILAQICGIDGVEFAEEI